MLSVRLPQFAPSTHGLRFANAFPDGTPVVEVPTPFGTLRLGNAAYGLCGGMVFAAIDCYRLQRQTPDSQGLAVVRFLSKRLLASWNLPFGVVKYYDWQRRSGSSKTLRGQCVSRGVTRLTLLREWPRIRAHLDAVRPVPLGVVKVAGYGFKKLNQHHQVLCYGYDFDEVKREVSLAIYDPNYPGDDSATLKFHLRDPDAEQWIEHSCEGRTVRGIFLTPYRPAKVIPSVW